MKAIFFTYWTMIGLQTSCDVKKSCSYEYVLNSGSRWTQRNFPPSADECENSLLVSNSAHKSVCTVKVKHHSEVTISTTFLSGGGLQFTIYWSSWWNASSAFDPSNLFRSSEHFQHNIYSPYPLLKALHFIYSPPDYCNSSHIWIRLSSMSSTLLETTLLPGLQVYPERYTTFPCWPVFIFLLHCHSTDVVCKVWHSKTNILLFVIEFLNVVFPPLDFGSSESFDFPNSRRKHLYCCFA